MGKVWGIWLQRALRAAHRPPGEIMRRLRQEGRAWPDRYRAPPAACLAGAEFAGLFGAPDLSGLWRRLAESGFPAITTASHGQEISSRFPDETQRIEAAAKRILSGEINILGLEAALLPSPPNWSADFTAGHSWPERYFRDLDLNDLDRASDVKVPWELSRMQWLIPVGQQYLISGENDCAEFVRLILADWIDRNAYGRGVNWGVAMEAAMRLITWSWLFHVFAGADAWKDETFRERFLKSMYQHAVFCDRYLEDYGAGGNHLIADATALVFAGSFFANKGPAAIWAERGWRILGDEFPRQVGEDGVDFEASSAYHRFVAELFLWAARRRLADGAEVPDSYQTGLKKMAKFTAAYTRPDRRAPLWGDNDNGRVLPFGGQHINDHSYLPALIAASIGGDPGSTPSQDARGEIIWAQGAGQGQGSGQNREPASQAFTTSGVYVMASGDDHIFIDCATVGAAGRGGHGHNDCLSFEAYLDGVPLITDSGSYVYTASAQWRDRFRGSAAHNAPLVDGQQANRFVGGRELFLLHDDAVPDVRDWSVAPGFDRLTGAHSGYQRLARPVTPVRTIVLDKSAHRLAVRDQFEGGGEHDLSVTLHFAPGIELSETAKGQWKLTAGSKQFELIFAPQSDWTAAADRSWISESYGAKEERACLSFQRRGELAPLKFGIYPAATAPAAAIDWLDRIIQEDIG